MVEMNLFNQFLMEVHLEDVNPLGQKFTWYRSNGVAMSMIDRVLITEECLNVWGVCTLWALPRDVSDHYSLVLKVGSPDWGSIFFLFNNYWIQNRN